MTAPRDLLIQALDGHAYTYPDSFCECGSYLDGSYAGWQGHMADALLASPALDALVAERNSHGPGSFWTQAEWAEWSNDLAFLIPEDDVSRYANPEGAQESIVEACLRAYVSERAALDALVAERVAALAEELAVEYPGSGAVDWLLDRTAALTERRPS